MSLITIIGWILCLQLANCETFGTLEITVATASLASNANAFADICIQNDSTTAVTLPFKTRASCGCQTKTITSSSIPVWQQVCTSTARYTDGSRIVIEVFNQTTSTSTNFLGGLTVTVAQLVANGDNNKQLTLAMAGGTSSGSIVFKVNYVQTAVVPSLSFGYLDVSLLSAEVGTAANAYADICVLNASAATTAVLPVKDRTTCSCQTKTVSSSVHPIWQQACTSPRTMQWLNNTRLTFEVWDQLTTTTTNFIGGASLTVLQMLQNGDNKKELPLALAGGTGTGKIWAQVTWTPV